MKITFFNEQSLRICIAEKWGLYGAHIEVFDDLLRKARVLELLKAGGFVNEDKLKEAEEIANNTKS